MSRFFRNRSEAVKSYFRRIKDARLARAEGYAAGTDDATRQITKQIKSLTNRISYLTTENLQMEERVRKVYEERLDILEKRHTKNCKECMQATEFERERLRNNQNVLLDLIHRFNIVFMKVFKHANLVVDEHDNIIKSSGRVKASRDVLLSIKSEADQIIKKAMPLLSVEIVETGVITEHVSQECRMGCDKDTRIPAKKT